MKSLLISILLIVSTIFVNAQEFDNKEHGIYTQSYSTTILKEKIPTEIKVSQLSNGDISFVLHLNKNRFAEVLYNSDTMCGNTKIIDIKKNSYFLEYRITKATRKTKIKILISVKMYAMSSDDDSYDLNNNLVNIKPEFTYDINVQKTSYKKFKRKY